MSGVMSRVERRFAPVLTNKKCPDGNCFLLFSKDMLLRRGSGKGRQPGEVLPTIRVWPEWGFEDLQDLSVLRAQPVYKERMLMNRNDL